MFATIKNSWGDIGRFNIFCDVSKETRVWLGMWLYVYLKSLTEFKRKLSILFKINQHLISRNVSKAIIIVRKRRRSNPIKEKTEPQSHQVLNLKQFQTYKKNQNTFYYQIMKKRIEKSIWNLHFKNIQNLFPLFSSSLLILNKEAK